MKYKREKNQFFIIFVQCSFVFLHSEAKLQKQKKIIEENIRQHFITSF